MLLEYYSAIRLFGITVKLTAFFVHVFPCTMEKCMKKQQDIVVASIAAGILAVLSACIPQPAENSPASTAGSIIISPSETPSLALSSTPGRESEASTPSTYTPTSPPVTEESKIAFVSDGDIYVMNEDGTNWINLTESTMVGDGWPSWSPDGTKIAFVSVRDLSPNIYLRNADGSREMMLTHNTKANVFVGGHTSWSPDGGRLVFDFCDTDVYVSCEIYLIRADGSDQIRLTNNQFHDGGPSWSPEGSRISFESNRDGNNEIYVMDIDGGHLIRLTNNDASDYSSSWSQDGKQIAYTSCSSNESESCEIYVMNADGSQPIRLTDNNAWECCTTWSPGGKRIAFVSDQDAQLVDVQFGQVAHDGSDLYVMNATDGSNLTRLTAKSEANNTSPSWSPMPSHTGIKQVGCFAGWSRLAIGDYAAVADENETPNRVRSGPSLMDKVIMQVYPGTPLKVIEGPVCADGLIFWKVEHKSIPGGSGWTAEGDGSEYWLEPYTP